MALKHIVELSEKELKELICKSYGLEKGSSVIRISQVPAEYNQGTCTTVTVEAKAIEKQQNQTVYRSENDDLDKSVNEAIKNR